MKYKQVTCSSCGHQFDIAEHIATFSCNECGYIETKDIVPSDAATMRNIVDDDTSNIALDRIDEAENYFLQAEFILHALQANISVYGSNSAWSGANPADVDLALKYVNRSLEIWPDNPKYLNLKSLFLIEGKGDREGGLELMEKAAKLAPDDITIQDNLEKTE